jgi:large subunit ribosomal protein L35
MPKQKTSRAARKRFKVTGAGKILRRRAMKSHLLEKKSAKRKRSFRRPVELSGKDVREVVRLLGGRKGGAR